MQSVETLHKILCEDIPNKAERDTWIGYLSQLKGCHLYALSSPSKDMDRWLKDRKVGIGGSEIAAIMGHSDWKSPRQVWLDKMGLFDESGRQQSEPARWGNLLESVVANEWANREDRQWIHIPVILQDDERPYLLANIDGFTLSSDRHIITGILEIKTTSAYNEAVWKEGPLPLNYLCQTNWYCGITRLPTYTLVCLVGGQHLYSYELPADEALFKQEVEAADTFWLYNIQSGIEPVATAVDNKALSTEKPDPKAEALILDTDEADNLTNAYCDIGKKVSELEKIKEALKAQIKVMLKGSAQAVTKSHVISVTVTGRRVCNFEAMADEMPEAYEKYVSISESTRMTIK